MVLYKKGTFSIAPDNFAQHMWRNTGKWRHELCKIGIPPMPRRERKHFMQLAILSPR